MKKTLKIFTATHERLTGVSENAKNAQRQILVLADLTRSTSAVEPHYRTALRLRYQSSDGGKIAAARAKLNWADRNQSKRAAHNAVNNAVHNGKMEKPESCEQCGCSGRIHGHHDDYSKPMDVRWLCPACHRQWHVENGPGVNGIEDEAAA